MNPTVKQLAEKLVLNLKTSRTRGMSSPEHEVSASKIVSTYKSMQSLKWEIDESDVRHAVWYAVVEMKQPIGSTLAGYFWCLTSKEINDYVLPHLISRIKKQNQKIEALKEIRNKMATEEAGQEELLKNPIGGILKKELGLEKN